MNYQEALHYREMNLHLIGMDYKGSPIQGIFIYPREEKFWESFSNLLYERRIEPINTAKAFPSQNFGLKIHLDMNDPTFLFHLDLSLLSEEYRVQLPEGY